MATKFGPSNIDPAEWTWMGNFYQGSSENMADAYRWDEKELEDNLGFELWPAFEADKIKRHENNGCASCGTHFAHGVVFKRGDEYVAVGHICGHDLFGLSDLASAQRVKAEKRADGLKLKAAGLDFAKTNGIVEMIEGIEEVKPQHREAFESITRQLVRRGSLSPKQVDYLIKMWEWRLDEDQPEVEEIEVEVTPVPESDDRIQITGTVISHRFQESDYGTQHKMLVEDDRGFRVWGTVPSSIEGGQEIGWTEEEWPIFAPTLDEGDRVTFSAKVERSRDDESFGFYKRPTKAEVVERAEEMVT